MNILVHYIAFHPDNYHGGSGKSFEFKATIQIPLDRCVGDIPKIVSERLDLLLKEQSPFKQDATWAIQKMEIL